MGIQVDRGYVFRPANPLFWLPTSDGGTIYFFYSDNQIAAQTFDALGNPLSERLIFATQVDELGASFVTQLDNGNYLLSYRDYLVDDGVYSFVTHYDVLDADGNLLGTDSSHYDGFGVTLGVEGIFDLSGGHRVELFRTYQDYKYTYYLNVFNEEGTRSLSSHVLQSEADQVIYDAPALIARREGGFAVAIETSAPDTNELGLYELGLQVQFFAESGNLENVVTLAKTNNAYWYNANDISQAADGRYILIVGRELYTPRAQFLSQHVQYVFDELGSIISEFEIENVHIDRQGLNYVVTDSTIHHLNDGGWIVVWGEGHYGWEDLGGIDGYYFQRFDAAGNAVGDVVTIDDAPSGYMATIWPSLGVTALNSGGFVMTWYANDPDSVLDFVPMHRVFDAEGNPLTKDAQVSGTDYTSAVTSVQALGHNGWRVSFEDGSFKDFHVNGIDTAPVAYDVSGWIFEDLSQNFRLRDFLYSDVDGDLAVSVIISTLPSKGDLTFRGHPVTEGQSIPVDELTRLRFRPEENEAGQKYTQVGYRIVTDGSSTASSEAFFNIGVGAINDKPTASSFNLSMREDAEHQFALRQFRFQDVEAGELAHLVILDLPKHGALFLGNRHLTSGTWIDAEDVSKLQYVPSDDYFGKDRIGFHVVDADGGRSKREYFVQTTVREVVDKIFGTKGSDILEGKSGTNVIYGWSGSDEFISGPGNDVYLGGAGQDHFLLGRNSGIDLVRDYDNDILFLKNVRGLNTYTELARDHIEEKEGDLWIYYSKSHVGSALVLENTSLGDVEAKQFWL